MVSLTSERASFKHVTVFNQFGKIVVCYKQKWVIIDVIKQSACLAIDQITVDHFAYLFCTPVGWGSDSLMVRLKNIR